MDPNATLRKILELQANLLRTIDDSREGSLILREIEDAASELCDTIGALDTWLTKGGFLPERWDVKRSEPVSCKLCVGKGVLGDGICHACKGSCDESRPNVHDPRTGCWVPVL